MTLTEEYDSRERRCEVCGRPSEAAWCRHCTADEARRDARDNRS